MDLNKLRGLPMLNNDGLFLVSFDMDVDFIIDQELQEPIRETINRYIQKSNPKVFMISTDKKNVKSK